MVLFSRTGIPRELLTDQGSNFVGSLVSKLCAGLDIDKLQTAPYRPEFNGLIERMHKTLGAILRKCVSQGRDWAAQLPLAMFALHSTSNRDTLLSPFELLYGKSMRTPLELLHEGWLEREYWELDVGAYTEVLAETVESMRDALSERALHAIDIRKKHFDRKCVRRKLEPGHLFLVRKPGMCFKLKESWAGPLKVLERMNVVNYRILVRKKRKVLHINNVKVFVERKSAVMRMVVVGAMDVDDNTSSVGGRVQERSEMYVEEDIVRLKAEFLDVLLDLPGKADASPMSVELEPRTRPNQAHPYRIPDCLEQDVKDELFKIISEGYVEPSKSPLASPIVPIPKSDGSVRLCIDFKRLI